LTNYEFCYWYLRIVLRHFVSFMCRCFPIDW